MRIPLDLAVDAVLQLDWDNGGWLAEAQLTEARIETGDNPALILSVQRKDAARPETRSYTLPAIAAAIIHLCRKSKIPLPRDWEKRIEIVQDGFEFKLEGTVKLPRRYGPLPEGAVPGGAVNAGAVPATTATPPASGERTAA